MTTSVSTSRLTRAEESRGMLQHQGALVQAWLQEEGELSHALLWASGISLLLLFSSEKASNPDYCNRKKKSIKRKENPCFQKLNLKVHYILCC